MANTWLDISSWNLYSYCGYTPPGPPNYHPSTLEEALDAKGLWQHEVDHVHRFYIDLGDVYTIKWLRGRSNAPYYNPWYVDVYVSNYDSFGGWYKVASNINNWRFVSWGEVNCTDRSGRYILVEVTQTQWADGWPNIDYLDWGIWYGGSNYDTIFDAYGCLYEVPVYLGGQAICTSSTGAAELNGIAKHLSSSTGGMLDPSSVVNGITKHLSSSTGGMLTSVSTLNDQFCYLKGEITITSTVTATGIGLGVSVTIHGSTIGISDASGVLEFMPFTELVAGIVGSGTSALGVLTDASVRLAGTIAIESTTTGELSTPEHLVGLIAVKSTVSGELSIPERLSGSITISSTVEGQLAGITRYHAGVIGIQSLVGGEIDVEYTGPIPIYLTGVIACQGTTSGTLAGFIREYAGVVAITSTVGGLLSPSRKLTGTITAGSSCAGNLTTRTLITGTVTSTCLASGTLKTTRKLIGSISPISVVSGILEIEHQIYLAGEVTISSTAASSLLKIVRKLISTISAESTCSGLMATMQSLVSVPIAIQSTTSGLLERGRNLTSTVTAESTLTALLSAEKTIAGLITISSTLAGNLIVAGEFRVTVAAYSTVGGVLKVGKRFTGTVTVITTVDGNLRYRVPRFVIADVLVLPVLICTISVSSSLESTKSNQPVLAHAVRASPVFTYNVENQPIFEHSTRVNDKLKLLTV